MNFTYKRRRNNVTLSPIGWAHTHYDRAIANHYTILLCDSVKAGININISWSRFFVTVWHCWHLIEPNFDYVS